MVKNIYDDNKLKHLIEKIGNESIINKIIKGKKLPLNYFICINCYECFTEKEISNHSEHFILKLEDFTNEEDELYYDDRLNTMYDNLKSFQKKIIKYGDGKTIKHYGQLLLSLYDIIVNDNSYYDLEQAIININKNFLDEAKLSKFSEAFKNLFVIFCQKIIQLTYLKVKQLFLFDLEDDNETNFTELEEDLNFLETQDKINQ